MNTVAGRQDEDSPKLQTMLNIMKVLLKLSREHTEIFEGDLQNILSLSQSISRIFSFFQRIFHDARLRFEWMERLKI